MADGNLQDFFEQRTDGSQLFKGGGIVVGTGSGTKSLVLQNDVGEIHLAGNPVAGTVTLNLPASNGTLIMGGQAIQGFGVSTGGNTSGTTGTVQGTVVLAGGNNITLSQSTNASGATITISGPSAGGSAVVGIGVSTGGNTSGNTGTTQGTYVLAGGNQITLSQSTAAGSLATLTISARDAVFGAGVSTAGNTSGNTGTTLGTIVFVGSNLVTLSQSTAAGSLATITISGDAPTLRSYSFPDMPSGSFGSSNAGFSLLPVQIPVNVDATRIMLLAHLTAATNSTGSVKMSIGVYTLSGSTASLASSTSRGFSWSTGTTNSTATSVYGGQSGTRYRSFDLGGTWLLTPGNYLFGFWAQTSNVGTWTFYGVDQTVSIAGGADTAETQQFLPGFSTSSFTTAMPASINVTDTNYVRTGISAFRQPGYLMMGT